MPKRGAVLLGIAGLTLVLPALCSAQVYAGAAVGVGGAREPIGSYAGGYRGTLRLYGGYEFNRHVAAEVMTLDLGTPRNRPETTIGAFGVAAVGMLPVQRWRFSGRLGVLSMDGRAEGATTRTAQGMLALGVGFTIVRGLIIGLETAVSRVEFGAPIHDTTAVNWTALTATYRF
jgi:hypothetical protein